jgi:c-di-GMP-related signal transduction protein
MMGMNNELLPRDRVVLEILEDSFPDPGFLTALGANESQGLSFRDGRFQFSGTADAVPSVLLIYQGRFAVCRQSPIDP